MSRLLPPLPQVGASDMDNAKQGQAQAAVKKPWSKPRLKMVDFDDTSGQIFKSSSVTIIEGGTGPGGSVAADGYDPNIS